MSALGAMTRVLVQFHLDSVSLCVIFFECLPESTAQIWKTVSRTL